MFKKTVVENTALEDAIARLLANMKSAQTNSEEYAELVDNLVKLHALKEAEKPESMSMDAKATIVANLTGIVLILNYERAGVVATKAMSLLSKLR